LYWLPRQRQADCIGHILHRNRQKGREDEEEERKQPLDDLAETRRYWKLKEEALDPTLWWTRFGIVCGLAVRQTVIMMILSSSC